MQDIPWFYFNLTLVNISQKYTNKQIKLYKLNIQQIQQVVKKIKDG